MYKSFKNEDYYEKNTHLPFDPRSKIHYTFTFIFCNDIQIYRGIHTLKFS